MTIPDRTSIDVAKNILVNLLPDPFTRKIVCHELATYWQYAKRNFPNKTFITLANHYIRMNVGMVEVFVIYDDETVQLVVDKSMVDPDAEQVYASLSDALPKLIPQSEFIEIILDLRQPVFSVINKLGKTRKHPSAPIGHSPALAELLETEYPYDSEIDYPDEAVPEFREGQLRETFVNRYERDPEARAACLRHYGSHICQICGFDFESAYGSIGKEFIHVHHLRPIAVLGQNGGASIDPKEDMLPVCPNCHAMLHTRRPQPWTPEDIKKMLCLQ
jgi:hypothetical protein